MMSNGLESKWKQLFLHLCIAALTCDLSSPPPQSIRMHNKKQKLFLLAIAAILSLFSRHAMADCFPAVISACSIFMQVPASVEGGGVTLALPLPYVRQQFTAECINGGYVADESTLTCELEQCSEGTVNMCGQSVPVPGGTVVGQNIDVPIPPVSHAVNQTSDRSFSAQCVDNNGIGVYEPENEINVSCSAFPCPDTKFNICGVPVDIPGGAALGDVLNFTAPAPYIADPFQVQCLASNGKAPVYEITDYSSVTCIAQDPSE
jgi:hypothetical protein